MLRFARFWVLLLAVFALMVIDSPAQSTAPYDTTTVDGQKAVVIGTSKAGIAHPTFGDDVTWTSDYVWVLDDLVFVPGQTALGQALALEKQRARLRSLKN